MEAKGGELPAGAGSRFPLSAKTPTILPACHQHASVPELIIYLALMVLFGAHVVFFFSLFFYIPLHFMYKGQPGLSSSQIRYNVLLHAHRFLLDVTEWDDVTLRCLNTIIHPSTLSPSLVSEQDIIAPNLDHRQLICV